MKIHASRAGTTKAEKRGPQTWTSEGSSHDDGVAPDTRGVDGQQGRARHAVLQAGPCRDAQRLGAPRQPRAERADALAKRQDLIPPELETCPLRHGQILSEAAQDVITAR